MEIKYNLTEEDYVHFSEGLIETTSNGETRAAWASIESFKEDKAYFFLYNSSISAYIIPKTSIEQPNEVHNIIRANLEK